MALARIAERVEECAIRHVSGAGERGKRGAAQDGRVERLLRVGGDCCDAAAGFKAPEKVLHLDVRVSAADVPDDASLVTADGAALLLAPPSGFLG